MNQYLNPNLYIPATGVAVGGGFGGAVGGGVGLMTQNPELGALTGAATGGGAGGIAARAIYKFMQGRARSPILRKMMLPAMTVGVASGGQSGYSASSVVQNGLQQSYNSGFQNWPVMQPNYNPSFSHPMNAYSNQVISGNADYYQQPY